MRMMMFITFPTEKFNAALRAGTVGPTIQRILEDTKPEAAYFGEHTEGKRGCVLVVDIPGPDKLSAVTEPWYLAFDADIKVRVAMTAEDIGKLDLDGLAKRYG